MITREEIRAQIPHCLTNTDFSFLGEKYQGKVRDCYVQGKKRYLITTDRLSAFDVVVTSIPFKGQVLSELALSWFKRTEHIVRNHIIDVPDPNVIIGHECEVIPIEIVMRGYLAGSAWRDYEAGKEISGIELPKGLRRSEKLPAPILTPSTKAAKGHHDEPISESEILGMSLVRPKLWEEIRKVAFALFAEGQKRAAERGLILVDTKYEFGLLNGKLVLVDEIHTLDSSRYWIEKTYRERFEKGEEPEMLDKEPTRQWLLSQGFKGDGPIPHFTDDHRVEIAERYINSFGLITGAPFNGAVGSVEGRIRSRLS